MAGGDVQPPSGGGGAASSASATASKLEGWKRGQPQIRRTNKGPWYIAAGWASIIILGASSFVYAKKDLDRLRIEAMEKNGGKPDYKVKPPPIQVTPAMIEAAKRGEDPLAEANLKSRHQIEKDKLLAK